MTTLNAMLPMEAAEVVPLGTVFWSEVLGTALLTLLGVGCLLYTSPSPRDATLSRMPSSA